MSSLLPQNATPQEVAMAETVARISDVPVPLRDLWNPDTCQAELLPWLAWAFSVDEWSASWSIEQQRAAVKKSYSIHRHKGTIGAVIEALNALGLGAQVQEWFNQIPAGDPYTYRLKLEVGQQGVQLEDLNRIIGVVESSKNLRSHLDSLDMTVASDASVYVAAVSISGHDIAYTHPAGALLLDGSWALSGAEDLDGLKSYFGAA